MAKAFDFSRLGRKSKRTWKRIGVRLHVSTKDVTDLATDPAIMEFPELSEKFKQLAIDMANAGDRHYLSEKK